MNFKDYTEFTEFMKACGFKTAEADFLKSVNAPYVVYFRLADEVLRADGEVFAVTSKISVELYTTKADRESETALEAFFAENGINCQKTNRAWDVDNKLCVTYYDVFIWYEKS